MARLRAKGFKLGKELRSPWYDNECDRTNATPQTIAKELDRDYGGSMFRIFGADVLEAAKVYVRPPFSRGMMTFNPEVMAPDWEPRDDGEMLLWTTLDSRKRPPPGSYVVASDLSYGLAGSYTSNSVIEVFDARAMEQVFEWATNSTIAADVADTAVVLCKWFYNAYLIWEQNGPGVQFGNRVKALEYDNVYYRDVLWRRTRKKTKAMGWWTDENSKGRMFGELVRTLKSCELKLHSAMLLHECGQYIVVNGRIVHVLSASKEDESSRGQAHGDRAIATAVALMGIRDRPLSKTMTPEAAQGYSLENPPPYTFAWRQREYEKLVSKANEIWDDRCGTGVGSDRF
jgi:hypothetical protein